MMLPELNERQKRLFLASEAISYGRGGIAEVMRITGVSRNTIKRGIEELNSREDLGENRVRRYGGGRKLIEEKYPDIGEEIVKIIDGSTYGDPERVLSYTTESLRDIADELAKKKINVSHVTVGELLESMNYSKQANQKMFILSPAGDNTNYH